VENADDTKIGREIVGYDDSAKLQGGIDRLVQWCRDWGMSLHPGKCVVLHFGSKNPKHDYFIDGTKINPENIARDLGVYISDTCDTSPHVERITKKAHGVLSQIRRATIVRDSHTLLNIYKAFIRPLLETAATTWNPFKRGDVDALEKVQKRSLRMMSDIGSLSYEEKLKKLNLQSLENRRERGDLIQTYKYLNGFNHVSTPMFSSVRERHSKDTRSHANDHLLPEKANLNIRKYFFTNRVTTAWNSLPSDVKEAPSVNALKNRYDKHVKCAPDPIDAE